MSKLKKTDPWPVTIEYRTAANLHDVLTAALQHANNAALDGHEALLIQMGKLLPFYTALTTYVELNS